jgi:hypothetical protein
MGACLVLFGGQPFAFALGNADRSLRRDRLPSFPSVPRAGVRFLQGLMLLSLGADGVSCVGMLDALRRQVVQGPLIGILT